jgi:hypothetical protein
MVKWRGMIETALAAIPDAGRFTDDARRTCLTILSVGHDQGRDHRAPQRRKSTLVNATFGEERVSR